MLEVAQSLTNATTARSITPFRLMCEYVAMLDFNRTNVSTSPLSVAINELIELTGWPEVNTRQYLGASTIGSECLRRVQFDWMVDAVFPVRTRDIFARGHFFEDITRQRLIQAGF